MTTTNLRMIAATIEGELAELAAAVAATEHPAALVAELTVTWARLVQLLPFAEPAHRGCPTCMRLLPRAATFCAHCYSQLMPASMVM